MSTQRPIVFDKGGIRYEFDPCGTVSRFVSSCSVLINSMIPGPADGGIGEIVLRVYSGGWCDAFPLTGRDAAGTAALSGEGMCFRGRRGAVSYAVYFLPGPDGWLWHVVLNGTAEAFELVCMQDLGLAEIRAQRTNELYTAQYLAHHPRRGPNGYVIASRQNLPQNGRHPCLWQGMLKGNAASYATDGTQYFGTSYRTDGIPAARGARLPGTVLQGESACVALETEREKLDGTWSCTFFALYQEDHPGCIGRDELPDVSGLRALTGGIAAVAAAPVCIRARRVRVPLYRSPEAAEEEVTARYPARELEERDEAGRLLSFFLPDHRHVVLQRKELLCGRPHGAILTTLFDSEKLPDNLLSSTVFMYGNFGCQTVVGNTSFHKLTSVSRGLYDWLPFGGTRLLIRMNGAFYRLGLPAWFEMGFNSAMWLYILPDDELTVRVYTGAGAAGMKLEVSSARSVRYDFLLTMRTVMGEQEFDRPAEPLRKDGAVVFGMNGDPACRYPELTYTVLPDAPYALYRDEPFFDDGQAREPSLLTVLFEDRSGFSVEIHGDLYGAAHPALRPYGEEKAAYDLAYGDFLRHFAFSLPSDPETSGRIDHTAYWFLNNAMIHFCVPHGLEQTGGAAWGTRDVCQGPFELLMATRHDALARSLLLCVFAHQEQDGDWPQWFMFDRYSDIRAGESHGDVILWPLKALGDYLRVTGDRTILTETVRSAFTGRGGTVRELLLRSVRLAGARFIPGTDWLMYGNGDWDDTLQPADSEYRSRMSSAWTQALAYQTMRRLAEEAENCGDVRELCRSLAERLKNGFRRMTAGDFVPGFCTVGRDGRVGYKIWPGDSVTGVRYRLIPYTRAILAGLVPPETARSYLKTIDEHLLAPDGARLLDRPTRYTGGNCSVFLRAEQAVNIGREVSLQYVHAHIRYAAASAACGEAGRAWKALLQAAPPLLASSVPGAGLRQSNVYFTSSDAAVPTREAFEAEYGNIMRGKIPVNGGWRLYSSGPGIWLALLLNDLLALNGGVPLIPGEYDGLTVTAEKDGAVRKLRYSGGQVTCLSAE